MRTAIFPRALTLLLIVVSAAFAGDVQIIANATLPGDLTSEDLKRIYLGTKTSLADGTHVEPVLSSGDAHDTFVKQFVGKTDAALRNYYKSLVFTGKGAMPKSFGSDAEVLTYVARTKGAIGYVSAGHAAGGVKVVNVK